MFDWVDENDPYRVLEEQYQSKVPRREYFAVHPDGTRVHFHDLPKATRKALWARDERLMDIADHDAEVERRRQIGLTINPRTAETTFCLCGRHLDRLQYSRRKSITADMSRASALRVIPAERGFISNDLPAADEPGFLEARSRASKCSLLYAAETDLVTIVELPLRHRHSSEIFSNLRAASIKLTSFVLSARVENWERTRR